MRILFANPIFLSFACIASAILIVVLALGGNLGEAATMVLMPYFSDIHLGFGKDFERLFQVIPAVAQIAIFALILVLGSLKNKYARISVTVFGVILVVSYFVFLTSVQLIGAIH